MKQVQYISCKKLTRHLLLLAGLLICLLRPVYVQAQSDTGTKPATDTAAAVAAPEEAELISPAIELISIQKGDSSVDLKATVKAKVEGKMRKLYGLKAEFFMLSDTAETAVGTLVTDRNGFAVINLKAGQLVTNADGTLHFKVKVAGPKNMEAGEGEVTVKRAMLILTPVKEDNLLSVQLKLVDLSTGEEKPVPETAVGIFVKRSFYPLKLGEGNTDTNGEATVEVPNGLPGDPLGNITLLAKLDENETYGYLETASTQKWGVPVSNRIEDQPRALWSSHPPMWMLITFIILMTAVWGHYIVIVYELFRLRKEQPHTPDATHS
jgi:hypothetical protein